MADGEEPNDGHGPRGEQHITLLSFASKRSGVVSRSSEPIAETIRVSDEDRGPRDGSNVLAEKDLKLSE